MKRIYIFLILLTGLFAACKKDSNPILEDPETRLTAALLAHKANLVSATEGWKATIYPKGGKGFSFYFKFTEDGKVDMLSDFNGTTASTLNQSTYRLKALQRPTLIFDTYNYIHMAADPDANISGGTSALGLKSDFEFAFVESAGDTLKFEGTFNGNTMNMVKLNKEEAGRILAGQISNLITHSSDALTGKILFLMLDNKQVPISVSVANKALSIAGQSSSPFSFGVDGLELKNPVAYGDHKFSKVNWNEDGKYLYFSEAGKQVKIEVSPAPLPLETTPALHSVLGKRWSSMQINVANLPELSADFKEKYNTANTKLGTLGNVGRYIEYITLLFNANGTVTFQIRYRNPSLPASFYLADFIYNMVLDETTGIAKFTLAAPPAGNASTINTYVTALTGYFTSQQFKIAYIAAGAPSGSTVGGFLSQDNPASFFYGVLAQ